MKLFIIGIFVALVLLSGFVWMMQPKVADEGKTPLVWVTDENPARRAQIELFEKINPEYDLRPDPNNIGTYKVIVQSRGGVGPDIFDCYGPSELAAYVKSGTAWDITDELKKAGIDVNKEVWKVALPSFVYEGRVYGFPTNAGANAIWINKGIFDSCGVPYPKGSWTWDEFVKFSKQLTVRDKNGRVKHFAFIGGWASWPQFVHQWGGRMFSEDGTRCVIDSPESAAALQFLLDMTYKHHIMPTPTDEQTMSNQGGWGSGHITWFSSGKAAMALGQRWWLCNLRLNKDLGLGVVECPSGKYPAFFGGARTALINRDSPRRREALEFIKFLASREYNEMINHQADSLSPVKKYCYTDKYLHDPDYPQEDCNHVWRAAMDYGRQSEISPFINADSAGRIVNKQIELISSNQKAPADGLKAAARQINMEIQRTLERDPELKVRYEKLAGRRIK